jgi:hypothetical protein
MPAPWPRDVTLEASRSAFETIASPERAIPVAVSVLVILLVAIVQERSRALAAIIATMPLDGAARHVGRVLGEGRRSTADGGVRALDVVGAAAYRCADITARLSRATPISAV